MEHVNFCGILWYIHLYFIILLCLTPDNFTCQGGERWSLIGQLGRATLTLTSVNG